jgi:hypothetical protein
MYSPRIYPSLIPIIYKKAKEEKKPMTKFVNDILRDKLSEKFEYGNRPDKKESSKNNS